MDQNTIDYTDYFISDQIDDTISQLRFFPSLNTNLLASCGWDAKIRIWDIRYQLSSINTLTSSSIISKNQVNSSLTYIETLDTPILCLSWQGNNPYLFAGTVDGSIYTLDIQKRQKMLLGKHLSGCKDMVYLSSMNVLLSGGWDGKINIWDFRTSNPVLSCNIGSKVYTMSNVGNLLVVGCSEKIVCYFNLAKLNSRIFEPEMKFLSQLKYQTRRVACFPEGNGYAIGSIEGRVAIKFINMNIPPKINQETNVASSEGDYAFRCHRTNMQCPEVFPVNDIAFNPVHGTFATIGGNGEYIFWDKDAKTRLKQGALRNKCPLTAGDYSRNGDIFAYAAGYDWARGIAGEGAFTTKVGIRILSDQEKLKKK